MPAGLCASLGYVRNNSRWKVIRTLPNFITPSKRRFQFLVELPCDGLTKLEGTTWMGTYTCSKNPVGTNFLTAAMQIVFSADTAVVAHQYAPW